MSIMLKKIKILYIINNMNYGGIEKIIFDYFKYIDKNKFDIDFVVSNRSISEKKRQIEKLGGRVYVIEPYYKYFSYKKQLIEILKNKYDIVHSNMNLLNFIPLKLAKKYSNSVTIAHNHSTYNIREYKKYFLKKLLKPYASLYADYSFACSNRVKEMIYGKKKDIYIIHNAIEIDKYIFSKSKRFAIRKELNYLDNNIVIGNVGRFASVKNHEKLIEEFYKLYKDNNNYRLLLIGDGPKLNKIVKLINRYNLSQVVKIISKINNTNDYYQAMDIFCLTSIYEGLPIVTEEAQASNLNCVISNNVTKEVKLLESTIFMDLDDDWSSVIKNIFLNDREDFVEQIISDAGYNIKNEVRILEKIYCKILKR